MLTGKMAFGSQLEKLIDQKNIHRLKYQSATKYNPMVPYWMDAAIEKALSVNPEHRPEALSEFLFDLQKPNKKYQHKLAMPLIEKNPLRVWQALAIVQTIAIAGLIAWIFYKN